MDKQLPIPAVVTDVDEVVEILDEDEQDRGKPSGGVTVNNIMEKELPTPVAITRDDAEWQDIDQRVRASLPANNGQTGIAPSDASQQRGARIGVEGQKRKNKVASWTHDEHKMFLLGLEFFGRGCWKTISTYLLPNKTPSQLASHDKAYLRRQNQEEEWKRKSINDTDIEEPLELSAAVQKLKAVILEWLHAQQQQQQLLELSLEAPPEVD